MALRLHLPQDPRATWGGWLWGAGSDVTLMLPTFAFRIAYLEGTGSGRRNLPRLEQPDGDSLGIQLSHRSLYGKKLSERQIHKAKASITNYFVTLSPGNERTNPLNSTNSLTTQAGHQTAHITNEVYTS